MRSLQRRKGPTAYACSDKETALSIEIDGWSKGHFPEKLRPTSDLHSASKDEQSIKISLSATFHSGTHSAKPHLRVIDNLEIRRMIVGRKRSLALAQGMGKFPFDLGKVGAECHQSAF